jgi:hypothetical protein
MGGKEDVEGTGGGRHQRASIEHWTCFLYCLSTGVECTSFLFVAKWSLSYMDTVLYTSETQFLLHRMY